MNAQATTSLTATMAVENDMRHRVRTSSFPAPSFHTPSSLTTELEAAALQHSPVPTLLLDRYQVVCVANRAAQKLFGSIDSLIGQSFNDFKIDFVNKAGFSKLDCDSELASLEDRWLGRRDSVTWPSFKCHLPAGCGPQLESRRMTLTRRLGRATSGNLALRRRREPAE